MERIKRTARSLKCGLVGLMALILPIGGLAAPAPVSADPSEPSSYTWSVRSPLPTHQSLMDILFANETFFAVGTGGTILASPDGIRWQSRNSGTSNYFSGIANSDEIYVAVGEGGTILSSEDGIAWTSRSSGAIKSFRDVAYGGGLFVAVGDEGLIATSPDGKNWTERTSGTAQLSGVDYGGDGRFVAVGNSSTALTSTNGTDWTLQNNGIPANRSVTDVVYGEEGWLAVGYNGTILVSGDGTNWSSQTADTVRHYYDASYVNGKPLLAGGGATLAGPSVGESWTNRSLEIPFAGQVSLQASAYGNGTYVTVGGWGTIATSSDGTNWIHRNKGTVYMLNDVAYHDGKYVAVGENGVILASPDGTDWSHRASEIGQTLTGVVHGDGIFMGVGYRGTMTVSSDGESFDIRTMQLPDVANISNASVLDVTYGNGTFVAAGGILGGNDMILVSEDKGESWTRHSLGTANYNRGAAFGNDTFIVVGTLAMGVSKDGGATWSINADMKDYYDVAYANGTFVAVGGQGKIATSQDGLTWQLRPQSGSIYFRGGVTYADNTFLAVGSKYEIVGNQVVAYDGQVATSPDGVDWTIRSVGIDQELLRVAYGDHGFVAVGRNGTIVQSSAPAPDLSAVGIDVAAGLLTGTSGQMEYNLSSLDGTDGIWLTASEGSTAVSFGPSPGVYVRDRSNPSATRKVGAIPDPAPAPNVAADLSGGLSAVKLTGATTAMEYSLDGGLTWNAVSGDLAAGTATIDAGAADADLRVRTAATSALLPSLATERLNSTATAITRQPSNATAAPGGSATFTVQATGVNLTYQWQFDALGNGSFFDMPFSTGSSLTLVDLTEQQNGQRFRVVVTGENGSATSEAATLTVTARPGAFSVQATRGNGEVRLIWSAVAGATEYGVYMAAAPGQYGTEPVATVTSSTYTVNGLNNGTPYYFKVQAKDATGLLEESGEIQATPATAPGAPTGVSAVAGNGQATVSFAAPVENGGIPITGYEVAAMPGNVKATGSGSPIVVTGLTNGTVYTFTVKAINGAGESDASAASNAATPTAPPGGNNGGSGGNGPSSQPGSPTAADNGVQVLVNGKPENAGTAATEVVGGRRVTTIAVDEQKLRQRLDSEGLGAVITIPVGSGSETVVGELNGRMVKNMEDRQAVIEIRTEQASYSLPALRMNMNDLAKRFAGNPELQDIEIRIEIAVPSDEALRKAREAAAAQSLTIVAPPLEFSVKAVSGGQVEEITAFNAYVQRTLAIPAGADPDRITTGVAIDPDGTVRHVPTKIIVADGKYHARINSLTNSAYSVVWHPREYKDAAAHWAQKAVNDMGSRMVVNGTGDGLFSPDRDITRAEFAAIVVRGLGLRPESGETAYADVKRADWFSGAIRKAHEYGLVNGFADGSFRPGERITREQAMTILAKALAIAKPEGRQSGGSADLVLRTFADAGDVSGWAAAGAADSVSAGLISGRSGGRIAPQAYVTRAEAATMIQRLLQTSDLINE